MEVVKRIIKRFEIFYNKFFAQSTPLENIISVLF